MAKKSFRSLPKKAQRAAFASMSKEGKLGMKHPVTGKRNVVTAAMGAARRKSLDILLKAGKGTTGMAALKRSLKRK